MKGQRIGISGFCSLGVLGVLRVFFRCANKERDAELEEPGFKYFDPQAQIQQIVEGIYLGVFSQVRSRQGSAVP